MLTVILLCVSVVACVVFAVRARIREARAHKLPPAHPGKLPIIGHTHLLISDTKKFWQLLEQFKEYSLNVGGLSYTFIGNSIHYILTDPDDALTAANACLQKHFIYDFAKNWLGQGLVTSSGEINQRHRKLLNPGFTAPVIHGFIGTFNTQARQMIKTLDAYVGTGLFDPSPFLMSTALETACLTTFGSDVADKKFLENYMNALSLMLHSITQRFQKFYLQSNLIYKLTGLKKIEDENTKTVKKLSKQVIQHKKEVLLNEKSKVNEAYDLKINDQDVEYKPYLNLLLELLRDGLLTDEEILDEMDTNIAASFETTLYTLTNVLVILGSNPDVQDRIYEESIKVLDENRDIEKGDLQKLVYTKAAIKECLRVLPIIPVTPRYVQREVKLKNYTLRADSNCVIMMKGLHENGVWGPDRDQFKPERWLNPSTMPSTPNAFGGFSLGKRSCPGMTYAMTFMTILVIQMVRNYKWTADVNNMVMKFEITLKPARGQEINIIKRRKENPDVESRTDTHQLRNPAA